MIIRWRGRWKRDRVGVYSAQREGGIGQWEVWAQVTHLGLGPTPWVFRVVLRRNGDPTMRAASGQAATLDEARIEASIATRRIAREWSA